MIASLTSLNVSLVVTIGKQRIQWRCFIGIDYHPFSHVMTGSYNNTFHLYDREGNSDIMLQADKSAFKAKRLGSAKNKMALSRGKPGMMYGDSSDFNKKILHASWHPQENVLAVAATNNLFIFT